MYGESKFHDRHLVGVLISCVFPQNLGCWSIEVTRNFREF